MTAAVQTLWAELVAATLADRGVITCVISPGSRSTPLVAALAADGRCTLPTIIDERAAAFYALGAARATGQPVALVCTSGTAAAHYLPAIVEASLAGVPLIAITADRAPELQHCGATQTIDQIGLYGGFVRVAIDLGAPVASAHAMRAARRKLIHAIERSRGPRPGPVHLEVPLRKPLEPQRPTDDDERALARVVAELRSSETCAPPPQLVADRAAIAELAIAISDQPRGVIVVGAMPAEFAVARDAVFALAARAGYPVLAEASSQLRFCPRPPNVIAIDHFDTILGASTLIDGALPALIVQLGAEPVGASWAGAQARLASAERWVIAESWRDPDASARGVIIGDPASSLAALVDELAPRLAPRASVLGPAWLAADRRAAAAIGVARADHPRSEAAAVRAAVDAAPPGTTLQIGNSLPIRVIDQVPGGVDHVVLSQRGAAGIDGLISSAAGATRAGRPVLLVLGDVSFAHDLGGLLATREAIAALAIVVIDNGGGRIFDGLPIAAAGLDAVYERHFVTAPRIDPIAIASALGIRAAAATSPASIASAVATALATPGITVIHAPVSATGAVDVRRAALAALATPVTVTVPDSAPARSSRGNHA